MNPFQTNSLLALTYLAGSAWIPGRGWLIYGGSNASTTQLLPSIGAEWRSGPNHYVNEGGSNYCAVQVTKNSTARVAGSYHWKCRTSNFFDIKFSTFCNLRWTIVHRNLICTLLCRFSTYNLQGGTVMSNSTFCILSDKCLWRWWILCEGLKFYF